MNHYSSKKNLCFLSATQRFQFLRQAQILQLPVGQSLIAASFDRPIVGKKLVILFCHATVQNGLEGSEFKLNLQRLCNGQMIVLPEYLRNIIRFRNNVNMAG